MKKKNLNMKSKKLMNKLPINVPIDALIEPIVKEKKNKERFYVNPDRLDELIKEYYKTNILTDELAEMVAKITNNLSFAPNFVNYCVDSETEALTKRGWLKYNEINYDDIILSYNIKNDRYVWSKIEDIYINKKYNGIMHYITTAGLDALVTPYHKFVSKEEGLKQIEYFKCNEHIVLLGNPPVDELPIYNDNFVELMGWAVTEGYYVLGKNTHAVQIFQKIGVKADRIQKCLERLKINYRKYNWSILGLLRFIFNKKYANDIIKLAPKKILSMEFILNLTQKQRILLIKTMIDSDGWTILKNKRYGYIQKDKNHVDSFLALCTLAGYKTFTVLVNNKSHLSFGYGSKYYNIYINADAKPFCKCEHINFLRGRPFPGENMKNKKINGKLKKPNIPTFRYKGVVWCPKTEYGTFVCRRNRNIYITGNTYKEEMIGDAIIKCINALKNKNVDPDKGSSFWYFSMIAYNAFRNRIKKEKQSHATMLAYQSEVYDRMIEKGLIPSDSNEHDGDDSGVDYDA